jgi:hypothetical protein
MKSDQTILVELVDQMDKTLNISKVFVDIELYTKGQYRYGFRLNPTDQQGKLRIDYEMVEAKRKEAAGVFLMDYNTPLTDCDNRVKIYLPTAETLRKAIEGIGQWFGGKVPDYAKAWMTANNAKVRAAETFVELREKETVVQIQCEINEATTT